MVPLGLTMRAQATWQGDPFDARSLPDRLEVGVDPARFGDDETTVQGRRGKHALVAKVTRKLDNVEVAALTMAYVEEHRKPGERALVRVDGTGLGSGVVDILRRNPEIDVVDVTAGSESRYPDRFVNCRAELWWCIRRWLERGGSMPEDQRRDAELLAARFSHDAKLRVRIESKDDMKKRLGRSPDRADALALACYGESPLQDGERGTLGPTVQPGPKQGPHTMTVPNRDEDAGPKAKPSGWVQPGKPVGIGGRGSW